MYKNGQDFGTNRMHEKSEQNDIWTGVYIIIQKTMVVIWGGGKEK